MTKSRGILRPRHQLTDEQVATLVSVFPRYKTEDVAFLLGVPSGVVSRKATSLGLSKSAEYLACPASGRLRKGDGRGAGTLFNPGHKPWNKGLKFSAGGRSVETRFAPGLTPHNTMPIGSYRYDKNDVLMRKISNHPGNNSKRWRTVHELVWVEAHGPLPPKHIVVFKPGMRTNVLAEITLDKVECISLVENMKRNTRHRMPKEINDLIALKAALTRQINKRTRS